MPASWSSAKQKQAKATFLIVSSQMTNLSIVMSKEWTPNRSRRQVDESPHVLVARAAGRRLCECGQRRRANMGKATMGEANLGEATMGNANMGKANMGKANMGKANMGKANMGKECGQGLRAF